jgi:excisionase family DNA binding protein
VDKPGEILTTGQVAKICRVAPRTVSKWFDTGQLRGYRIPGSKDRRIPLAQLIRFMKVHGMPLTDVDTGLQRLLIVDADRDLTRLLETSLASTDGCEVRVAESAFEAGVLLEQFRPSAVLVDIDTPGLDGPTLSRFFASRPDLREVRLVATSASLSTQDAQSLLQQGFHAALPKPFTVRQLSEMLYPQARHAREMD